MNTTQMNREANNEVHGNTADALYSYFIDCRFDESPLNGFLLTLALEYVYQPHARFWRDFDVAFVVDALSRLIPHWRAAVKATTGKSEGLLREVEAVVRIYRFDETNAELIAALPHRERPSNPSSAFGWIADEYRRTGHKANLGLALEAGNRCGECALAILHGVEQAWTGAAVERTGTLVARTYRQAVMERAARKLTSLENRPVLIELF